MAFKKATKKQAKARIGLIGPSGSGKTYTALKLASGLGGKIAVIDTEHGSASKYADKFEFDVLELDTYHPQKYIDAIKEAAKEGYDVLVIDSLSHAWAGTDGAIELADKNAVKYGGNKFAAWRDVTPLHNKLVEAIITAPLHVIATMRAKMQYIQTQDEKGKTIIKKVGLEPVQRDGMEYEFDIVADMDIDHNLIISKTRCEALDGLIINKPGEELAKIIKDWLTDGVQVETPKPKQETKAKAEDVKEMVKRMAAEVKTYAEEASWTQEQLREHVHERYGKEPTKLTLEEWQELHQYIKDLAMITKSVEVDVE
ncbi:ATP-binding protein [Carboxydothermus pertinax]|uniref:AAA+ ATPase domain-containing protein n=1 Tax=Carboxydothermus pertinax TaxID=870242 RepID=A0A1L8CRN1_9THEO|nr:ATP-binding protein [Carboxydothermus pertinax]GAV21581.1 hypothetical protein cpu_00910 [Carboxydothermus pertinax]